MALVSSLCFQLLTACDGSLAQAVTPDSPEPQAGLRDYQSRLLREVPGGVVNTAGGNLFVSLRGLSLETALGREEVAPSYNSASNRWRFGAIDMSYDGKTFVDPTGSEYDVTAVVAGTAIPGSVWIKVDADTIRAKDGLSFEFAGGVVVAKHRAGQQCPRILYEDGPEVGQVVIRQEDCSLRGEWSSFNTDLFSLSLDASGRVVEVSDRAGHAALYSYDEAGRLVTARDGLDVEQGSPGYRLEYSGESGPLAAMLNSEGERIEYEFYRVAALGNFRLQFATQVAQAGEGSLQTRFDYYAGATPDSGETVVTDPLGDRERYSFDGERRLQRIDYEAVAESESFTYAGSALRPASHTLANGSRKSYTRDAGGDILTIVQPSGNVVVHSYADANSPFPNHRAMASKQDDLGVIGSWTYSEDAPVDYKRLASAENGEGERIQYAYHPNAGYTRLASVTFPGGVVREFAEYNALGAVTQIVHGPVAGNVSFDEVGNQTGGSNGRSPEIGGVLTRRFDADRNPVEVMVADSSGQESTILVPRGSDGRILAIDRPPLGLGLGPDHRFSYDTLGRVVQREEIVDGAWQSTSYAHDARGRTGEVLPNGMSREWLRDQRGRITEHRVYRDGVMEGEILFSYSNGNLIRIDDSERGTETRSYDGVTGLPTTTRYDGGESIEYEFDLRSRLVKETYRQADASVLKVVEHEYDLANRETRVYDDGQLVVDRSFTGGKVDCTETGNGLERCFSYEPVYGLRDGAITTNESQEVLETTLVSSGLTPTPTNWEIFATTSIPGLGEVEALFTVGPGTDTAVPGSEVGKRVLAWDNGIAALQSYAYDGLSNQVDDADGDSYGYNLEGNRLLAATVEGMPVAYTYDAAGFASSRNGLAIEWTAAGRMAAHGAYEAEWDMRGRPLRVSDTSVSPTAVRDWSRWGGRIEVDGDGLLVALDLGEVVLGFDGARRYRHFDFRGNVSFVSDENGTIVTLYEYSPYGVSAVLGDGSDTTRFVGRSVIGPFMLLGARMYDPLVGRFISPDPVFNLLNQYTYTLGNPIWFSDPTGRTSTADALRVGGTALGMTLAIVSVALATTPLAIAVTGLGLGGAIIGFFDATGVFSSSSAVESISNTGCDCTLTLELGPGPAESENPAGAAPPSGGDGRGDSSGAISMGGTGGFGGTFGGGFGGSPACGLTGMEFLFFVGWALGRKNKQMSS
jgi:RHS repeat-associated protein